MSTEPESIQVKREGYAWSSDSSGSQYAVFDRAQVERVLGPIAEMTTDQLVGQLTGWSEFYRGVGRAFGSKPRAKLYRHAVLITQETALDI